MNTDNGNAFGSPRQIHLLGLMVATAVGLYLCYEMVQPFVPSLTWAAALAVLFMPLHRRLQRSLKSSDAAAAVSVMAIAVVVVVLATFIGQRLASEALRGAEIIRLRLEAGEAQRLLDVHPSVAPLAGWIERQVDLPSTVGSLATWLTDATASLLTGSLVQVTGMLLTFYLAFYFLRDQEPTLEMIGALSPLTKGETDRVLHRVADTVHATVYGTLVVAAIQGVLGGLMFWWLGLPAPLLWGVIMGALAVIPVLGAFIVWVPAAIFLVLDGSWGKALVLSLWGGVLVGGIDNVIYPILVGNRLKVHTIPSFISIVGGLIVFGASGLILGPVTLTVTMMLLEIWRERNRTQDGNRAPSPPSSPSKQI